MKSNCNSNDFKSDRLTSPFKREKNKREKGRVNYLLSRTNTTQLQRQNQLKIKG